MCAALASVALLYKARVLRTDRSAAQLALIGSFFFLVVIFTVSTPAVWVWLSRAVGIENFSGLLSQSSVIALSVCQQLVLLSLTLSRGAARRAAVPRIVLLGVVLGAMVVLFFEAAAHGESPDDFAVVRAHYTPAYLVVYLAAFTLTQIGVGVMGWRYSRLAPSPWLRRGLRLVALSLPFSLCYSVCRAAGIVAAQFGGTGHAWEPAAQIGVALAVCTQTIGWILPDWGPHLTAVADRIRYRRAHRILLPLHRTLTEQVPGPVIPMGRGTDLRTRLYRTLIEIRDAQWELRTWMDEDIAGAARREADRAGFSGEQAAAVVEAAQLRGALAAKARDEPPARPAATPLAACPPELAAELLHQQRVARALGSRVVDRAVTGRAGDAADAGDAGDAAEPRQRA
ncbi:MAB_1171c family putative transporter [Streptomyces sp. NPDC059982]|uniref:MAB_1171c family putative transporter n=1 Tax=unclassified Streptomyces TaxID=2593676 RepID=UPI0036882DA9